MGGDTRQTGKRHEPTQGYPLPLSHLVAECQSLLGFWTWSFRQQRNQLSEILALDLDRLFCWIAAGVSGHDIHQTFPLQAAPLISYEIIQTLTE